MIDAPRTAAPPARDGVVFGGLATLLFVAILLPVLLADRHTNDDLLRALSGNYGWTENGRHLTNTLMRVLQFGASRVIDLAPLPQLLAVLALAWAGMLVARRFAVTPAWLGVLVALPLGAQPFFLENLAFRFDAPFMALAVALALLPVVSPERLHSWRGALVLLASLALYQPAITVFVIFALLEAAVAPMSTSGLGARLRLLVVRVLQGGAAALVYQLAFARSIKGWIAERGAMIRSPSEANVVIDNVGAFGTYVTQAFPPKMWAMLAPALVLAFALPLVLAARRIVATRTTRGPRDTALQLVALPLIVLAALASVAGPMLLLADPLLVPRVLPGVGALVAAGLVALHVALRGRHLHGQAFAAGSFALAFAVAAGAYSSAARQQGHYERRIAQDLADDLADIASRAQVRGVVVTGSAGAAIVVARMQAELPLLRALVPSYLREDDFNTRAFLGQHVDVVPLLRRTGEALDAGRFCAASVSRTRQAYVLRLVGDVAVADFRREPAFACRAPAEAPAG